MDATIRKEDIVAAIAATSNPRASASNRRPNASAIDAPVRAGHMTGSGTWWTAVPTRSTPGLATGSGTRWTAKATTSTPNFPFAGPGRNDKSFTGPSAQTLQKTNSTKAGGSSKATGSASVSRTSPVKKSV